jgi:hypothetical protein
MHITGGTVRTLSAAILFCDSRAGDGREIWKGYQMQLFPPTPFKMIMHLIKELNFQLQLSNHHCIPFYKLQTEPNFSCNILQPFFF